jgi:hypothetical protein
LTSALHKEPSWEDYTKLAALGDKSLHFPSPRVS